MSKKKKQVDGATESGAAVTTEAKGGKRTKKTRIEIIATHTDNGVSNVLVSGTDALTTHAQAVKWLAARAMPGSYDIHEIQHVELGAVARKPIVKVTF